MGYEMRIVMESTRAELQEEKRKNDLKNSTIEKLNEKVCRITEDKKKLKSETDRVIEDLELTKKVAEDEHLSKQQAAKEKMLQLEKSMSVQQQQHLSCWMLLKSMEVKLSAREAELNNLKDMCLQNEELLE